MKLNNDKMRFFLGFTDTCGVYRSVEQSLLSQGHRAYFLNLGNDLREKSYDNPFVPRLFRRAYDYAHCEVEGSTNFRSYLAQLAYKAALIILAIWVAVCFDVLLIKSGAGLTRSRFELRVARAFGRKIIFSYHGSDSRPFYLGYTAERENYPEKIRELESFRNYLQKSEELADIVIDSPSSAHLHMKQCCLRQVIFNPAPLDSFPDQKIDYSESKPLRLLHAPSDPLLKGTDVIRRAVLELKSKGYIFEFREVNGVSNEQVIEELLASDIVVDEMYSDNYAGIFALEGLTARKVVVVGGYAFEHLDEYVPDWARAPTARTRPEKLVELLESLLCDHKLRQLYRSRADAYIKTVVCPAKVVKRLVTLAGGEAPSEWFFDPKSIEYIGGAAAPMEEIEENIAQVYKVNGAQSFSMEDKMNLQKILVNRASKN